MKAYYTLLVPHAVGLLATVAILVWRYDLTTIITFILAGLFVYAIFSSWRVIRKQLENEEDDAGKDA
jgi:hypothetical protein